MTKFRRILRRMFLFTVLPLTIALGLLAGCQSKLIYFPRPYGAGDVAKWDAEPGTRVIDYQTAQGKQQAYLLSKTDKPEHLWLVCGGNGTLALEWSDWLREFGPEKDAWLIMDMPGYGACAGDPSPGTIRNSLKAVVPAGMQSLGWSLPADQGRLRFFGHSLGAAVCLEGAKEFDIRKGVVLAPFTSTMEMTKAMFHVNLGFLVWHRFDNLARLKEMEKKGGATVYVFHGANDEAIPAEMSRKLAKEVPSVVHFTEVPRGRHNTLQEIVPKEIGAALEKIRE